jgi:murein L,D-transpeptidase YafK
MLLKTTFVFLIFLMMNAPTDTFKDEQKKYPRVRQAYKDKESQMLSHLKDKKIDASELEIYIRAFKSEKKLQLWGKNKSDDRFSLIKTYDVCATSGKLGPKRKQGDGQIPEGFYHIDRFNPYSSFYLSLGINYPNRSDRILGNKKNPGGDIFIHGDCVTIGCLPITDQEIKELYIFCVEAKNNGQNKIPVHIFPSELTEETYESLCEVYKKSTEKLDLWKELKLAYDIFNDSKKNPDIEFLNNGRHKICAK